MAKLNFFKLKCIIGLIVSFLLMPKETFSMDAISAQNVNDVFTLTGAKLVKKGNYNFKDFVFENPSESSYLLDFWVLPATYSQGGKTEFLVYVNDRFAGRLKLTEGGWQSAQLENDDLIFLEEGENHIRIATVDPEIPMVEAIRISNNPFAVKFSSADYAAYKIGVSEVSNANILIPVEEEVQIASIEYLQAKNIPLMYTFFTLFDLPAGQEMDIITKSSSRHNIDMFLYCTDNNFIEDFVNPYADYGMAGELLEGTSIVSAGEMQGLNWLAFSEQDKTENCQKARLKMTAPRTGTYMIRVRPSSNNGVGMANVNVNGLFEYENVPIASRRIVYKMPADGTHYAVIAIGEDSETNDPMVFVLGADSDRVVGFNDDAPALKRNEYELSKSDAFVCQQYYIPTEAISVNNFHSNNPISTCTIIAGWPEEVYENVKMEKINGHHVSANISDIKDGIDGIREIEIQISANSIGEILISANEEIKSISGYSVSGQLISDIPVSGEKIMVNTSELNFDNKGVYIIRVTTINKTESKKIIVR